MGCSERGPRHRQAGGRPRSARKRRIFAVLATGFTFAGPLAAQEATPGLSPPALAYVIVGGVWGFFWLAFRLINDYNRQTRETWDRLGHRWRFYSVFTVMMFTFFFQCVAIIAVRSGGVAADNVPWWSILFFILGLVPFPVLWLELIFTHNSRELGFTKYYEANLRKWRPEFMAAYDTRRDAFRHKEEPTWYESFGFWGGLAFTWLWVYVLSPLSPGFHLRHNHRHGDLARPTHRHMQAAQDILMTLTAWLALGCLIAMLTAAVYPALAKILMQVFLWTFLVIVFSAMVLGFLVFLPAVRTPDRQDYPLWWAAETSDYPSFLFAGWGGALIFDLANTGLLSRRWVHEPNWFDVWIGVLPVVLALQLVYLARRFAEQQQEAREVAQLSASVADSALHRFGNLMMPPSMALRLLHKEIYDDKALRRLIEEPERHGEILSQIKNALEAVGSAQQILLDLKSRARRVREEHWCNVASVLKPLEVREGGPEDSWQLEIMVDPGPEDVELYVDREGLKEALDNLVENARYALEKRTRRKIWITAIYNQSSFYELEIKVRDNGPGIASKVRKRLYVAGVTSKSTGTGLGLHLVREFMTRAGGRVKEDSKTREEVAVWQETFTEFRLRFPYERVRRWSVQEGTWENSSAS